jgi:hypothetical protein
VNFNLIRKKKKQNPRFWLAIAKLLTLLIAFMEGQFKGEDGGHHRTGSRST